MGQDVGIYVKCVRLASILRLLLLDNCSHYQFQHPYGKGLPNYQGPMWYWWLSIGFQTMVISCHYVIHSLLLKLQICLLERWFVFTGFQHLLCQIVITFFWVSFGKNVSSFGEPSWNTQSRFTLKLMAKNKLWITVSKHTFAALLLLTLGLGTSIFLGRVVV